MNFTNFTSEFVIAVQGARGPPRAKRRPFYYEPFFKEPKMSAKTKKARDPPNQFERAGFFLRIYGL